MPDWHKELLHAWANIGQFDGKKGDAELAKAGRVKLDEIVAFLAQPQPKQTSFTAWVTRGNGHGQCHPETVTILNRTTQEAIEASHASQVTPVGDPKNIEAVLDAIDDAKPPLNPADDYDGEALIRISASRAQRDVTTMQAATKSYRDNLLTRIEDLREKSGVVAAKEDVEDLSGVAESFQQNLNKTVERLGEVASMFRERSRDLAEAARKAGPLAARKEKR